MKWEKLGKLYEPKPKGAYLLTHAANPTPVYLEGDVYRIFYSGRDSKNRSSVGCVDIDIVTQEIIQDHFEPVFVIKEESFYSEGISVGCHYRMKGKDYLFFMGWKNEEGQHWYGTIGQVTLQDKKICPVSPQDPYIILDEEDPISLSYPWIIKQSDGFKMWYGSTLSWDSQNGEMIHVIKSASSKDGESWIKEGLAVPYEENIAQAFSKPTVIHRKGQYHMWYSYRSGTGETYRIGYAVSEDAQSWKRFENESTIHPSQKGWDSEMICYPSVFEHKEHIYMLYNGNEYGKTGFGLCRLV